MLADLSPLIAATTQWLTRAYPAGGGAVDGALAEAQARQAVTVAARLRYPTPMDAALVGVAGPGGTARLDWITGFDEDLTPDEYAWRTWVDEVVASWAACLLADPGMAHAAVSALTGSPARPVHPPSSAASSPPANSTAGRPRCSATPTSSPPSPRCTTAGLLAALQPGQALTA